LLEIQVIEGDEVKTILLIVVILLLLGLPTLLGETVSQTGQQFSAMTSLLDGFAVVG
jgi:hypothetical protein